MRTDDSRVLAHDLRELQCAARVVIEQGEERGLVSCGTADNHLHAILLTHRDAAGRFAHDVETSLRWRLRLPCAFEPARFRPIESQTHFTSGFWYALQQQSKHQLSLDPGFDGTCLPEILGGRVMVSGELDAPIFLGSGIGRRVATHLPRIRGRDLLALVGGEEMLAMPPDLEDLPLAVAAAVASPNLEERTVGVAVATRAAAHLVADIGATRLARLLYSSPRTIHRHRKEPSFPKVEQAIQIQWRLRAWLRRRGRLAAPSFLALPMMVTASSELPSPSWSGPWRSSGS